MTEIETLTERYRFEDSRRRAFAAIAEEEAGWTESQRSLSWYWQGRTDLEYFIDFRERTHAAAIAALATFSIAYPRSIWKRAIDELHAQHELEAKIAVERIAVAFTLERAIEIHDRRGAGRYDWPKEDLLEAELETGVDVVKARSRIADLERRLRASVRLAA